jgi:hypothetical protein
MRMSEEDNDFEIRLRGLESALGPADDVYLHGVVPFFVGLESGGTPDVVAFSNYDPNGKLYVTCELVGTKDQVPNECGQYELAVCQAEPEEWGLDLVLKLAYYTLVSPLEHGETMDIGPVVPQESNIAAFLFKRIAEYEAFGKPANVICCIGITKRELDHCFEHGSSDLFDKMPKDYTETKRKDFV